MWIVNIGKIGRRMTFFFTRAAKDVRDSKASRSERKSGIKSVFFYERKPLTEFDLDGSDQCILCSVNACNIFTKRGRFEIHQLLWQHSIFHNSSFISGKVLRKTLIKLALPSFVRNTQSVLLFAKIPGSDTLIPEWLVVETLSVNAAFPIEFPHAFKQIHCHPILIHPSDSQTKLISIIPKQFPATASSHLALFKCSSPKTSQPKCKCKWIPIKSKYFVDAGLDRLSWFVI